MCHCVFHPADSLSWRYFCSHFRVNEIETFRSLTGLTRKNLNWDSKSDMLNSNIHQVFTLPHSHTTMLAYLLCTHMPMWPSQAFPSGRKSLAHSSLLFLFLPSPSPLTMEKHTRDTSQRLSFPQAKLDDPLQDPIKPLCLLFPFSWPFAPYLIYFCISLT